MATVINGAMGQIPLERPMPRRSPLRELWGRIGWPVGVFLEVVALLALWEYVVNIGMVRVDYISTPTQLWAKFWQLMDMGLLQENIQFSVQNFFAGYLLAILVGLPFGLLMGSIRAFERLASPFVWSLYSTPRLALAPMIVIWMGFAWQSKVLIVFLAAFFVIIVNAMAGVKTTDRSLLNVGRIFGANRVQMYTKVILPASLPFILNGLRLGIARGLSGMIVGEMIGSSLGLGHIVARAASQFDVPSALSATATVIVMANIAIMAFRYLEARLVPWQVKQRW